MGTREAVRNIGILSCTEKVTSRPGASGIGLIFKGAMLTGAGATRALMRLRTSDVGTDRSSVR